MTKKVITGIGYWFLQCTWGIIMTLIGLFATLFSLVFLKGKIHKNGFGFITEVGGNWGGVSLGAFSLCGSYSESREDFYEKTRRHEFGHSLQNIVFGPLFPFVVAIPSVIRYILLGVGKLNEDYYAIWFERDATDWGTRVIDWLEGE